MARVTTIKRNSFQQVFVVILSIILALGAIFGIGAIVTTVEEETQKTISSWEFSQGGLTDAGTYLNDKQYIYTEEAFSCKGLEIEVDFENEIQYMIYFYGEDGSLDSIIDWSSSNYVIDDETLKNARTCRVVIKANNDESIAFYEVQKYASQLTIKVDKVQRFPTETEGETN